MSINYRKIHDFTAGGLDGASPFGSLVQMPSTNFLYGTTYDGGIFIDQGTIFKQQMISLSSSIVGTYNNVHNFDDVDSTPAFTDKGLKPQGTLLAVAPNFLYGTATDGGDSDYYDKLGQGVLFRKDLNLNGITVLHSFDGVLGTVPNDGAIPRSGVIKLSNNKLYGTTANGGVNFFGTIYSYDLGTNTYGGVLHSFAGAPSDGARPFGELVEDTNNPGTLYGMTREGGTNNVGTIYRYVVGTSTYTKLYDFTPSSTGAYPEYCQLVQSGNIFYGVTTMGGVNNRGTIFSYQPPTNLTPLWSFPSTSDGISPNGTLIIVNGSLYGITTSGGTYNKGVIYSYNLTTTQYNVLYNFGVLNDGTYPSGGLTYDVTNQIFYGTTVYGGIGTDPYRNGTIYQFELNATPPPPPNPCVCYRVLVGTNGGSISGTTCDGITSNISIPNSGLYHLCYQNIFSSVNATCTVTTYTCNNAQCSPPPYLGQCQLIFYNRIDETNGDLYYVDSNPLNYSSSLQLVINANRRNYAYMTRTSTILYAVNGFTGNKIDIWDLTSGPTLIGNYTIPNNPSFGFPYTIGGIFYAGAGPKFYILNQDDNRVELWDYTTPVPTIQIVFTLPFGYMTFGSYAGNIYVDINNNIFYIQLTNPISNPEFVSLDSSGTIINNGPPPSGSFGIKNMYLYGGDLYTIDNTGNSYLTTPSGGGWSYTSVGNIGSNRGGLAQWYDESCIAPPPIGCILTGLTVSGCTDLTIEAHTGRTCYDGGFISVSVSGGCPDYIYTLYNPDPNTIITQVTASTNTWIFNGIFDTGIYYVSVTSCSGDTILTINPFLINADQVAPFYGYVRTFINGFCVTTSGGTPPYIVLQDGNPLVWIDNNGIGITTNCYTADCNTQSVIIVEDSTNT